MATLLGPTRRDVLAAAALASAASLIPAAANTLPTPEGPGSASGAPHLPRGFTDTFTSRYVDTGELRLHAVIGGEGPPLLLVHGWPQTWYQWRLVMPALARDFEVIAVDQRGIGLSDKPESGYDGGTQANDMVALMDALGHQRFAMIGFDTGMPIGYALAADHSGAARPPRRRRGHRHGRDTLTAAARPRAAQQASLAYRLQPARTRSERGARQGPRRYLLRRGVRSLGRDAAARRGRQVLCRPPCFEPRRTARQLRVVSCDRCLQRAEPAAQDEASDPARPRGRRRERHR